MIQAIRKILHLDTLEDQYINYKQSVDEISIQKSQLDELASEHQANSRRYLSMTNKLKDDISKGVSESGLLKERIEDRFKEYFTGYVKQLGEIKKSITKEQQNINSLLKDDKLVSLIEET